MTIGYSDLRAQKRVNLAENAPLFAPLSIYIEPTNICNFKCLYCPEAFDNYEAISGGLHQLSKENFNIILNEIKKIGGVKTINFYMMGEPFVNKNLLYFVQLVKINSLADRLIITTNGTLIRPKLYQSLLDSGLDYLRLSVYGGFEQTHKLRTKSSIGLDVILKNILGFKNFRDSSANCLKPHIYIKMIDSSDEIENAAFIERFSCAADEIKIEPVMNWNDPLEGNLSLVPTEKMLASPYFGHRKIVCPSPFYTLIIHSDLKVSVCCVDWSKQAVVGDLKIQGLHEIWWANDYMSFGWLI